MEIRMLLMALLACVPSDEPPGEDAVDTDTAGPADTGDSADTGEIDPDACFQSPPTVSVGTGETTWEPLDDGDGLTMIHGPQGGWHMLASALMTDMDPIVELRFTVTLLEGGAVIGDNLYTVATLEDGHCTRYYPGMYVYLDVTALVEGELNTPPELLSYRELHFWMRATDESGRVAEDERIVVALPDPQDVEGGDTASD